MVDADAMTPEQIERRRKETEEIIGSVAANTPFKVILAVQTLDTLFSKISLYFRVYQGMPLLQICLVWQSTSLSKL